MKFSEKREIRKLAKLSMGEYNKVMMLDKKIVALELELKNAKALRKGVTKEGDPNNLLELERKIVNLKNELAGAKNERYNAVNPTRISDY